MSSFSAENIETIRKFFKSFYNDTEESFSVKLRKYDAAYTFSKNTIDNHEMTNKILMLKEFRKKIYYDKLNKDVKNLSAVFEGLQDKDFGFISLFCLAVNIVIKENQKYTSKDITVNNIYSDSVAASKGTTSEGSFLLQAPSGNLLDSFWKGVNNVLSDPPYENDSSPQSFLGLMP